MKPISPEFLSGFTESDGSFYVSVEEKRLGRIMPKFHITQQSPPGRGPTPVLEGCRDFFGVGHYQRDKRWNCYTLTINSQWALRERVIPHFYSYPLLGEKKRDFLLFAEICHRLENKRRGDEKAWREIADLAVTMNRTSRRYRNHSGDGGESLRKLCDFRPSPAVLPPIHPLYVSGLTQGDGGSTMCFLQRGARPQFSVTSHNLSLDTLWGLKAFFGCGNVYSASET